MQEHTEYLKELKTEHDSTNSSHTIRKGSHPLFTYTTTNTHNLAVTFTIVNLCIFSAYYDESGFCFCLPQRHSLSCLCCIESFCFILFLYTLYPCFLFPILFMYMVIPYLYLLICCAISQHQ